MSTRSVSPEEAERTGAHLRINWNPVGREPFRRGPEIAFDHGAHGPETNAANDDPVKTGEIARVHREEFPDYDKRLERLEAGAAACWALRR